MARAMLANIADWEIRLAEVESYAIPGNKARILSLMLDMKHAKVSLRRLARLAE
jgi:hypothetical protein